jgi:hypothetical protein
MPYDSLVISDGQKAHELLIEELRLRLANEIMRRVGVRGEGADLHLDIADVPTSKIDDLLGEFWLIFGHMERRRLATAGNSIDLEIVKVVLEEGGVAPTVDGPLIRLDSESYRMCRLRAAQYDERRAAMRRGVERTRSLRRAAS